MAWGVGWRGDQFLRQHWGREGASAPPPPFRSSGVDEDQMCMHIQGGTRYVDMPKEKSKYSNKLYNTVQSIKQWPTMTFWISLLWEETRTANCCCTVFFVEFWLTTWSEMRNYCTFTATKSKWFFTSLSRLEEWKREYSATNPDAGTSRNLNVSVVDYFFYYFNLRMNNINKDKICSY